MGNNKPSLSNRNSNIELLRILCMLAMPMQHYISRGGIVESCEVFNVNNNIGHFLRSMGYPALLTFVLISGYFMFGKPFRFKRIVSTVIQTYTYSILFLAVGFVMGAATLRNAYYAVFETVQGKSYWYIPVYLGMCLIAPILEPYFVRCTKKQYQIALSIAVILFFVIPTYSDFNGLKLSQGVETFLTIYFLGGYIRRFSADYRDTITRKRTAAVLAAAILLSYLTYPAGYVLGVKLLNKISYKANWGSWLFDSLVLGMNNIFSLVAGTAFFWLFLTLPPKNNEVVNQIGKHTFGVYLFHENEIVRAFLWNSLIDREHFYDSPWFLLHAVACTLILFAAGVLLDYILSFVYTALSRMKAADALCARVDGVYALLSQTGGERRGTRA